MKFALAVLLGLAAVGCQETEQEYTLNPDGSGKVRIVIVIPGNLPGPFGPGIDNNRKPTEHEMKNVARQTLKQCKGVDAWTGVEAKFRDDGKVSFTGTAYFKNLKELQLILFDMHRTGPELGLQEDGQGGFVLELDLRMAMGQGDSELRARKDDAPVKPLKLTDEQIKAGISEARAMHKRDQDTNDLRPFLKHLRVKTKINVPGALGPAVIFKPAGPNSVEIIFEGKTMLEVEDELVRDDAFMRRQIESGKNKSPLGGDAFLEKMFGAKIPPRVVVKGPLKALFNYEAEAAPARAGMEALRARLGAGKDDK